MVLDIIGPLGESYARLHYFEAGFEILAENYYNHNGKRIGELDIVAKKDNLIVVVEVKTRYIGSEGTGFEAIDENKQRKLVLATKMFMMANPEFSECFYQIDACEVILKFDKTLKTVIIIENAVEDLS